MQHCNENGLDGVRNIVVLISQYNNNGLNSIRNIITVNGLDSRRNIVIIMV